MGAPGRFVASFIGFLAATAPNVAAAEAQNWQGVYEGAIGKARVVAALAPDGARYVYVGQVNDLGLIVSEEGGRLSLTETLTPDHGADDIKAHPDLVAGRWSVTFADGVLKGVWKDADGGRPQTIALTRVSKADNSADADLFSNEPDEYAQRWRAAAPALVAAAPEASIGPLSYRLMRDPLFGSVVPRLTRAPAGVRLDLVNASLDRLQREFVFFDRDCLQGRRSNAARQGAQALKNEEQAAAKDDAGRGWDPTAKPIYATDRLLTLEEVRDTFCGGAHPNLDVGAFTFDLRDGARLTGINDDKDIFDPNRLGRIFDLAAPKQRAALNALWIGSLRAAIQAREGGTQQKSDDDPGCGQIVLDELDRNESAIAKPVYPTEKGLAFRIVDFPHAVEGVCFGIGDGDFNPLFVPYPTLKPFLKAGQTLVPDQGPAAK